MRDADHLNNTNMTCYQNLSIANIHKIIDNSASLIVDIRDTKSFDQGRLPRAMRFDDQKIFKLRKSAQRHDPVLVYCYHGNSSKEIASLLCNLGFTDVYNLEGGYSAWCAELASKLDSGTELVSDPTLCHWLTQAGYSVTNLNAFGSDGLTPLMQACRLGMSDIVERLLRAGADINKTNNDGNNALWLACFSEDLPTIRLLIEYKVDIDNRNSTGATSLIYAASAGKSDVVDCLLDAGANPFIRTQDDFTALDLAASPRAYRALKWTLPTT